MLFGERRLDRWLARHEPIQRGVEFVLINLCKPQHRGQAVSGGRLRQRLGGGQFGGGFEQARHNHRAHQHAGAVIAEQAIDGQPAQCAKHRGDMAMRPGAQYLKPRLSRLQDGAALQQPPHPLDQRRRPVAQIEQGASKSADSTAQ